MDPLSTLYSAQPFWMQYLLYLKSSFTFDLGQDFSGR